MAEETKDGLVMTGTHERKDYATAGNTVRKYWSTADQAVILTVSIFRGV
tara:strand:+ start:1498 stop:1644 length:147 start_codon:yes stop_codon:yes gene_type:complete